MLESKIRKPSLSEQTLIVQEIEKQFTRLDASIKSLKSVKKKLEVYRKAVLKKAFEKKEGWESRIDSILDAGLKPIHIVRKVGYRDEEYVDFNEHELKDIIKNHRWIGIVFKRR